MLEQTLESRGRTHGAFSENARVSQNIKHAMADSQNWHELAPDQKEALEMCAVKMGRLLSGDPHAPDHWLDLSGYPKLVHDRLTEGSGAM